jgi:hypothetical protein
MTSRRFDYLEQARESIKSGMSPEEVADHVFKAIIDERLFILTHRDYDSLLRDRLEEILR